MAVKPGQAVLHEYCHMMSLIHQTPYGCTYIQTHCLHCFKEDVDCWLGNPKILNLYCWRTSRLLRGGVTCNKWSRSVHQSHHGDTHLLLANSWPWNLDLQPHYLDHILQAILHAYLHIMSLIRQTLYIDRISWSPLFWGGRRSLVGKPQNFKVR